MSKKQHYATQEKPWFCFDGDDFEYFATQEEALEASVKAIEFYCDEGWDEAVNNVLVGKATHTAQQTKIVMRPDNIDEEGLDEQGEEWLSHISYKCSYEALLL